MRWFWQRSGSDILVLKAAEYNAIICPKCQHPAVKHADMRYSPYGACFYTKEVEITLREPDGFLHIRKDYDPKCGCDLTMQEVHANLYGPTIKVYNKTYYS